MRVRDAASLIILDPSGPSVLMGRRSRRHAFFPGRFVFPGGRVDPSDSRVAARPYTAKTADRLEQALPKRYGPARARAFGVAALREAYEETGVLIGRPGQAPPRGTVWRAFAERGIGLDLSLLTFVCRAITPPGRPRRYDTRFFLADRASVVATDPSVIGPDAELEAIDWVRVADARAMDLPPITLTVLDEVVDRLDAGRGTRDAPPVPFFRFERKAFVRRLL